MNTHAKPFIVIGAFWMALFLFVVAGQAENWFSITGFAVHEGEGAVPFSVPSLIILVLFFTNIITLFFFAREKLK